MSQGPAETVTIISLVHDLQNRRSIVTLVWTEPDKRLALPVPYGTPLETLHEAATAALHDFTQRLAAIEIRAV